MQSKAPHKLHGHGQLFAVWLPLVSVLTSLLYYHLSIKAAMAFHHKGAVQGRKPDNGLYASIRKILRTTQT